jgi:hypothetical protein
LEPGPEWPGDDLETDVEMSDDDFEYDDIDEEDEEIEHQAGSASNVPVWRRIEMTREDRYLKRELADFEDYDSYDRFADDNAGLSH